MPSLQPLRTKEEIEANRLAAEERLRKTRAEKTQKKLEQQNRSKNDENRIVLSAEQRAFMAAAITSNPTTLTTEQRLRIEKNKQEALERLKLKQQKKAEAAGLTSAENALSPEQKLRIEKNKQEALERLKLKQQKKAEEAGLASAENALSPEQKLRIEKNKQEALERLKLKRQKIAEAAGLASSGKALPPSKAAVINHRPEPYAKLTNFSMQQYASKHLQNPSGGSTLGKSPASSKLAASSVRQSPYAKPQPSTSNNGLKNNVKPVECKMEATSETRFVVKMDVYHKDVISEFSKISSKIYDPKTRIWSFNLTDHEVLKKSLEALTTPVNLHPIPPWVLKHLRAETPTVNASCLESIDPVLLDTLLDHQKYGACYGIARGGRFLLADDMGLGKTFTALAVAEFFKEDWPLLIVTTAAMRKVWADTIFEYLPSVNVQDIRVVESYKTPLAQSKVVICSYQGLDILIKKKDVRYGMIILDESHEIKNRKAKQTQNALKFTDKATRVLCLTGTPALSRPGELFSQLSAIDGKFAAYHSFTQRYCEGHDSQFGWDDKGSSNLEELNVILRKKFMIRRTKDKITELGVKVREMVELKDLKLTKTEVDGMRQRSEAYNRFKDNNKKKEEREVLLQWYSETAKLKAETVARYIEDKLKGSEDKFLIFAHHICVLDAISEMLTRVEVRNIRIDGSTRPDIRKSNVNSFQNDPSIRCAVLSMKACSTGLTLTAASTVIFAELDWNPSILLQAEGRAHRIGQAQQVKSYFLIALGTSDDIMWNILQVKQRNLNPVGLVGAGDHFSQNLQLSKFDAGTESSTSRAAKSEKRITDYYNPVGDKDEDDDDDDVIKQWEEQENIKTLTEVEEKSTGTFYTCHDSEDLDLLMEEAKKAETPDDTSSTAKECHKEPNPEAHDFASIEWDEDE